MAQRAGLAGPDRTARRNGRRPTCGRRARPSSGSAKPSTRPVDFNIEPQPLKDAIEFIASPVSDSDHARQQALEDANIDTTHRSEAARSRHQAPQHAQAVARAIASPLTYVIEDEVMKITTVEKANEKLQIRMYPVGDLVMGPQQLRLLARRRRRHGRPWRRWRYGRWRHGRWRHGRWRHGLAAWAAAAWAAVACSACRPSLSPRSTRLQSRSARCEDWPLDDAVRRRIGTVFAQVDDSSSGFTNDSVQSSKKKRDEAR